MFAIIKDNAFERFLPEGIAFKIGNTVYAQDWLNLSTPAEKAALGIVDVVYGQRPNDQYYWVSQDAPVYSTKFQEVYVGYTATPKDLFMLQNQAVTAVQQQAYSILLPSDWRVVKSYETQSDVPAEWNTWRQEIRSQCAAQIVMITACKDVAELAALPSVVWAHDPNYVEPTGDI
jgi:hypothetical protein